MKGIYATGYELHERAVKGVLAFYIIGELV